MSHGAFTLADIDQSSPVQTGQFSAADLDAPQASAFQRLGESALSGAGVVSNEQGKNFFLHPLDTLKAMATLQGELGERAKKELANKDYVRGLTHGIEWLMPGAGPVLAYAGDQLESGDIAGGVGTTLGAAATLLAGVKAPAIAEGASSAASAAADTGAAAVRASARGVNQALVKAPGTIGGTVGAAVGAKLGGATGAELGGIAGTVAGKELLPQLRIPGEGFGFPNRVQGGPATIPPEAAAAAAAEPIKAAPVVPTSVPKITPAVVEQQLETSLGGRKLVPGVSLRNQATAQAAAAGKLPEGFTSVDSSALKGYKYSPETREFESITQGGQHYIHGDVSPDEVDNFADADSKGKAWQQIKSQNPLVAKVVNGRRVSTVPSRSATVEPPKTISAAAAKPQLDAAADDLSAILQESLKKVRAEKLAQTQ